jgi:hypothetical protein|tara:strand:- start:617 stop:868 length:252 start_codon:yes stop_codon:yes gene_type:complete
MSDEIRTAQEIAQDYTAMGHSVDLINGIIDSSKMTDKTDEDKKECVKRNVEHLEFMLSKEYWTNQDMTSAHLAITSGKSYTTE